MSPVLKIIFAASLGLMVSSVTGQESAVDTYLDKIRPVLQKRCYACHGALKQESDLRVDTVASMRDHGILDSGDLLERLSSDESDRMPPEGESLTKEELALITQWLTDGAPAPENERAEADPLQHWAFQKIERPTLPDVKESHPIDAFLAESQQVRGLKPQTSAPRSLLLRRLYLDLIGLPPTREQMRSEQSVPQVIDSLLQSPHYGERWGRHWMDVWRYSDWYGLDKQLRNSQRHIWHWREWIVDSLNEDKGYDRMVMEMLAGDEMAPDDLTVVAATGFLARNYYLFNRSTWLDDTIEHTGKAFLGLTLNCAKCHDHKYDPLSHNDYYRFRAIFEPHHVRLDALPGETDYLKNALPRVYDDNLEAPTYVHRRGDPLQPIEDRQVEPGPPKFLLDFAQPAQPVELPVEAWAPGVRDYVQIDRLAAADRQIESAKQNLQRMQQQVAQTASLTSPVNSGNPLSDNFQRSRPDLWKTLGRGWRYQGGLLAQTEATVERSCLRTQSHHPKDFELTLKFQTTGGQKWRSTGIRFDVDESGENSHTVYASAYIGGPKVQLAHTVAGRNVYPADARSDLPVVLNQEYTLGVRVRDDLINISLDGQFLFSYRLPSRRHGRLELFAFDSTANFYSLEIQTLAPETDLEPTDKPAAMVTPAQMVAIAQAQLKLSEIKREALKARIAADTKMFKKTGNGSPEDAARMQLRVALAAAEVEWLKADAGKQANAEKQKAEAQAALDAEMLPKHTPLRGSERALEQGSHKPSQYAAVYPSTSSGRRTALAHWITHRDNPLTARVAVNHIWTRHFGKPLVESVFDFGRRAPTPLHQPLLDYLASELIDSGWSMKHLHRLILTSKTWQRSSSNRDADPHTLAEDPENHYYWRMNGRRMESQVVRDSLLLLAGQLDLTMGGPPVAAGPQVQRRSLYLFHSRDGRDPFVSTFDDADVFNCYRRNESVVPQQALAMMNSREVIEAAQRITSRYASERTDDAFAIAVFQQLLARRPSANEIQACLAFLSDNPDRIQFVHALLNHNDFQVIR